MASEEQRQELLNMIKQIQMKLGSHSANSFASKNKSDQSRRSVLKQVFEKLQMAGVDLSDKESVAMFIEKLRQENPELADMFEKSMDVLLGGQIGDEPIVPQDPTALMDLGLAPQNNMNNININTNETIPQGL